VVSKPTTDVPEIRFDQLKSGDLTIHPGGWCSGFPSDECKRTPWEVTGTWRDQDGHFIADLLHPPCGAKDSPDYVAARCPVPRFGTTANRAQAIEAMAADREARSAARKPGRRSR
jgi:hypothetical protein